MAVLRITAYLATQVTAREQVHLDSILLAKHPDLTHHITRATPVEQLQCPPIPFLRLPWRPRFGVALCTAWILPADAQVGLERIVKRKDPVDVHHRAAAWSPSSGPEKNCMIPLPMALAPQVQWMAVGNARGVRELLSKVRQIGSVRRHGFGTVTAWEVEAVDEDPLVTLQRPDGTAARFLPREWCEEAAAVELGAVTAPYWHPAMVTERIRPGVSVKLRPEIVERVRACR